MLRKSEGEQKTVFFSGIPHKNTSGADNYVSLVA